MDIKKIVYVFGIIVLLFFIVYLFKIHVDLQMAYEDLNNEKIQYVSNYEICAMKNNVKKEKETFNKIATSSAVN